MNETIRCATGALLDTWSRHGWQDGLQIESLRDLTTLRIATDNSVYEITVISAQSGEVLVRGGRFFPEFTPARFAGCSLGGTFLKMRGVYVGFSMELHLAGRSIVTSRVRSIGI